MGLIVVAMGVQFALAGVRNFSSRSLDQGNASRAIKSGDSEKDEGRWRRIMRKTTTTKRKECVALLFHNGPSARHNDLPHGALG